jgi:hypothetical protein
MCSHTSSRNQQVLFQYCFGIFRYEWLHSLHVLAYRVCCHAFRVVTNNNGFWIWWLDLLTPSFTSSLNRNQLNSAIANLSTSQITRAVVPKLCAAAL